MQDKESSENGNDSSLSSIDLEKSANSENDNEYALLTYESLNRITVRIGSSMCSSIYQDRPFLLKESGMYCDVKTLKLSELGWVTYKYHCLWFTFNFQLDH